MVEASGGVRLFGLSLVERSCRGAVGAMQLAGGRAVAWWAGRQWAGERLLTAQAVLEETIVCSKG